MTNKHDIEQEELQAYLDGELTAERRAAVEYHLHECGECKALFEDLQRVSATLRQWEVEPAPATIRPPAVESGTEGLKRWFHWSPVWTYAGAAAVILIAGALSIDVYYRTRIEPLPEPTAVPMPMASVTPSKEASRPATPDANARREPSTKDEVAPASPPPPPVASYRVSGGQAGTSSKAVKSQGRGLVRAGEPQSAEAIPPPPVVEGKSESYGVAPAQPAVPTISGGEADALARNKPVEAEEQGALADRAEMKTKREAAQGLAGGTMVGNLTQTAPVPNDEGMRKLSKDDVVQFIIYNVSLTIEVKDFAAAKKQVETAVSRAGGYVAEAHSAETPGAPQRADLTLRVPAAKVAVVLGEFRGLGRVKDDQLSSQEVTDQIIDLEARLRNARATERRLVEVLQERTGKVGDVLEVEREIARTRGEIERLDAQRQNLFNRVHLATVQVTLIEQFQAQLQPAPVGTATRLRNAFVEGYDSFVATLLGFVFFFARHGLNLVFWTLFFWVAWRMVRRRWLRRLSAAG